LINIAKLKTLSRSIEVKVNSSIVKAAEELGVQFGCYQGVCGMCKISILEGENNLNDLTVEEKEMGMDKLNRLACQCKTKKGDVKISF
jgi:ferredoxin